MDIFDLSASLSADVAEPPDEKYFGDLALLRPISNKPINGLALEKFVRGENGFDLNPELKAGLEARINEFFLDRHMQLLPDYNVSPIWKNFEYMTLLVDINKREEAKKRIFTNGGNYDWIVGLLLAFRVRTPKGFEFMLYDKIGIHRDHHGNGHLKELINFARVIDAYLTKKYHPQANISMPAGLRTSEEEADAKYTTKSDLRATKSIIYGSEAIDYFVHLFGFLHPVTRQPINPFYSQADEVATYIASLPPSFRKI